MERYKNLSGNSAVTAYEIGDDSITVKFKDGSIYLYDNNKTGKSNIKMMKSLAVAGRGLSTFIDRSVKKAYAKKLK